MGQAWCKERSSKAQDSKSPLDRVFLRCAHRLYPGLKEEGSVLGGATQRVTSSEIGYAGSPSRDMLTRGSSIDSVDRPFQPSDWVDVNLEVPNTPRASSAMTNRTFDTTIYHTTTPSSSTNFLGCNLKNATPVPPPRRKKKIRDRPLPPKPDEVSPSSDNSIEPLYSSINKIKNKEKKNNNEFLKINGIDKSIPSVVVSGWKSDENISSQQNDSIIKNGRLSSTVSLPNYDELITSNKITNQDTLSCDEIDDSIDLKNKIILDNRKTSTPIKNNNNIDEKKNVNNDGWLLNDNKNICESLISDSVENKESNDQSDVKSKVQSFLVSEGSKDDLFFDAEDTKRTYRHKDPELKKFTQLKRSLSNDSETFENFEDKRLSIAPSSQTDSTPKNLTRSISEESFPSVLMEYQDDFFDEKIVKDTKNEITKIREELEAVKNEVKTPSSSPEPIIKPDIQKNDSSLLLSVINNNNENEESNLSSMTPSLNELEAALSDMLEKTDEHDNYNIDNNDIYETPNDVLLENPIEPNIVKLISDNNINELVDIDLNNDTIVNGFTKTIPKIRSLDRNDHLHPPEKPSRLLRISLDSLVNNDKIPTPPKRKNRSSIGFKENSSPEPYHNDRLI
ncbi:homeobox protein 14-like isoform X2 [Aphidius gifuensis]|uniref:homeobox protein 14-like isoform X2 n=1 Tax=Aphidius gifuensis TaxID=684658 RepID=UPI001CDC4525|nr:homeobox protein 14-like isoform X2 [Aphidius gifuensis]